MQLVTITAVMQDGSTIVERTAEFGTFAGIVLAFRADPDCRRLVWAVDVRPEPPALARAAPRGGYLAAVLGTDAGAVVERLGIPTAAAGPLLCRRPQAETWPRDVAELAAFAGCDPARLAALLARAVRPE